MLVKVRIMNFRIRLDNDIYKGSIINGTLLTNTPQGKLFIIDDLYKLNGESLTQDRLSNKMLNINTYLKYNMEEDNVMNNIKFRVNDAYELSKIRQLIYDDIPNLELTGYVKGLSFQPEISGTKLIYMYSKNAPTLVPKQDTEPVEKNEIEYVLSKEVVLTFKMKRTDKPDVYKLYLLKRVKENGKNVIKNTKVDIAYIPTRELSATCRDYFQDDNESILMKCKYLVDKKKWVPIERDTDSKRPDKLKTLLKLSEE